MDRILKILEDNARLSLEDIAAMTDKTPQEVAATIDEYAKEGVIKGYKTLIDWDKTDFTRVRALIEMCIRDSPHRTGTPQWTAAAETV